MGCSSVALVYGSKTFVVTNHIQGQEMIVYESHINYLDIVFLFFPFLNHIYAEHRKLPNIVIEE